MADFMVAAAKTLRYEGGLVNSPQDPGGLTNFGISQRAHPELTPDDIRQMTQSKALGIYRHGYWPDRYSEIQDQAVANLLFDFGVTSGPGTAVRVLQAVLFSPHLIGLGDFGFLRLAQARTADAGQFGENTVYNVNLGKARDLRVSLTAARLQFYVSLGRTNYLHSWFSRTIDALLPD